MCVNLNMYALDHYAYAMVGYKGPVILKILDVIGEFLLHDPLFS